jgi:hypothetical protein
MKKHCFLVTALLLVFAGAASAQQLSDPKSKTDVPFAIELHTSGTALQDDSGLIRHQFY